MTAGLDPAAMAAELRAAEPGDGFVPLLTGRFEDLTFADARAVALARDELRRADGEHQIGYKLGWTSAAMREALGIERPNWGTLWNSQRIQPAVDGTLTINRADYRHPKVEPELVYLAGADLQGAVTAQEVAAAAAGWAVGLEVVDPRFPSFSFDWLDNTADNSSAAAVAIGPEALMADTDPADWQLQFTDGAEVRHGVGEVVMRSPLEAVAWLVRSLAEEGNGEYVAAGMTVFTGGMAAPFDVTAGCRYQANCSDIEAAVTLEVN